MHQPFDQQMILTIGDMAIDTRQRSVFVAAERVDLTKREFDMLLFLAHHPGWAFTKDQLLEAVWLNPMDANHRAVENLIYWIRKKTSCSQSVRIKAVFGYGFKLLVEKE